MPRIISLPIVTKQERKNSRRIGAVIICLHGEILDERSFFLPAAKVMLSQDITNSRFELSSLLKMLKIIDAEVMIHVERL